MWGRQFGTSSYESPSGVATDAFDNAYVVGTTAGNLAGQYGSQDIFVRKYTRAGNVAWTIQFGTSGNDYAYGVASDSSGNVYVVGYQGVRQFLRKFNTDGSRLWTHYPSTGSFSDVAVDFSGNVYAAGTIPGANGNSAMLIRKFSPNGGASWSRQVEYSGGAYGTAVAVSGNHVYLVGYYQEREPYNVTPGFTKFSPDGVQQWSRPYGSYGAQYVFDASADSNGDLYFTGYWYNGSRWLGYVNKHSSYYGQDRWQKFVDAPQGAFNFAVVARTANEIYTGGYTYGNVGAGQNGNADVYLRHLNSSDGATVWTR